MADETTFRFVLQDEAPSSGASAAAAPAAAEPARRASSVADYSAAAVPAPARAAQTAAPGDIGEQYSAYQQMEAYRRADEEYKAEMKAARQADREEAKAARDQQAAQRKLDAEASFATKKAQSSIVAGLSHAPFGSAVSMAQAIADPIVSAVEAIGAQRAAAAGAARAASPPVPAVSAAVPDVAGSIVPAATVAAEAVGAAGASPAPAAAVSALAGLSLPLLAVGAAAAAAGAAMYGTARAAEKFDNAMTKRADRLASFSGDLAASKARASVEGLLQDVRAARDMGVDLAEYNTSRSSMDRSLQRISDVVSKAALEKLNPLLEAMAKTLEIIAQNGPAIENAIDTAADGIGKQIFGNVKWELIKMAIAALERNSAELARTKPMPGDLFTLFQEIPDLELDDQATTRGYATQSVHFDAIGGSQLP